MRRKNRGGGADWVRVSAELETAAQGPDERTKKEPHYLTREPGVRRKRGTKKVPFHAAGKYARRCSSEGRRDFGLEGCWGKGGSRLSARGRNFKRIRSRDSKKSNEKAPRFLDFWKKLGGGGARPSPASTDGVTGFLLGKKWIAGGGGGGGDCSPYPVTEDGTKALAGPPAVPGGGRSKKSAGSQEKKPSNYQLIRASFGS